MGNLSYREKFLFSMGVLLGAILGIIGNIWAGLLLYNLNIEDWNQSNHNIALGLSTFAIFTVCLLFIAIIVSTFLGMSEEKQKVLVSEEYVKNRIVDVYTRLIWKMRPPKGWEIMLNEQKTDWKDYYESVGNIMNGARKELEDILNKYYKLIEIELRNDIFEMLRMLVNPLSFAEWDEKNQMKDKIINLEMLASTMLIIGVKSMNSIKKHNLFQYYSSFTSSTFKPGEMPTISKIKLTKENIRINQEKRVKFYEQFLNEIVKFRDECHKAVFKPK